MPWWNAEGTYRDSTLTRVLEEALGGNSRTTLMVTASACAQHMEETLCSLRFATRAQKVRNYAHVNFVYSAEELWPLVAQLQKDLAQARRELGAKEKRHRCRSSSVDEMKELILQVPKTGGTPQLAPAPRMLIKSLPKPITKGTVSAESPRSESSPSAPSDLRSRCLEDDEPTAGAPSVPSHPQTSQLEALQVALQALQGLEEVLLAQEEALEQAQLLRPEACHVARHRSARVRLQRKRRSGAVPPRTVGTPSEALQGKVCPSEAGVHRSICDALMMQDRDKIRFFKAQAEPDSWTSRWRLLQAQTELRSHRWRLLRERSRSAALERELEIRRDYSALSTESPAARRTRHPDVSRVPNDALNGSTQLGSFCWIVLAPMGVDALNQVWASSPDA
eukprot:g26870.t1